MFIKLSSDGDGRSGRRVPYRRRRSSSEKRAAQRLNSLPKVEQWIEETAKQVSAANTFGQKRSLDASLYTAPSPSVRLPKSEVLDQPTPTSLITPSNALEPPIAIIEPKALPLVLTKKQEFRAASTALSVPNLTSLKNLESWVNEYIPSSRLYLTKKAIKAAEGSDFRNAQLVGESLLLIANEYYDYLFSKNSDRQSRFKNREQELRVSISNTFATAVPRHAPEKYQSVMPWDGSKEYLDRHLVRGNTRDPRQTLRIYLHAAGPDKPIVIGHLPNHLPNSLG